MILPLTVETLNSLTKTELEVVHFINSNEARLSKQFPQLESRCSSF